MNKDFKWTIYGQLGYFMWYKRADPKRINDPKGHYIGDRTELDVDNFLLRMKYAREKGANTVIVDIGEAIQYPSHPELWIDGALTADKAKELVAKLKAMGYESVIPSLNFSTDHHHWLGEYQRMVSTPGYYRVCKDVIRDAWEIFGRPSVLHLGYDEEDITCVFVHSKKFSVAAVCRQGALYWHDFNWLCDVCRGLGARPAVWMDKVFCKGASYEETAKNTPKDVLLMPWDYTPVYEGNTKPSVVQTLTNLKRLSDDGFDLIPIGSNWIYPPRRTPTQQTTRENIPNLYKWSRENLDPKYFVGFGVAPWAGLYPEGNSMWFECVDLMHALMPKQA